MNGAWVARVWEAQDDGTRLRAQCREAVKEYNASGEIDTEPQDWVRRVGLWVD